MHGHRPNVPIKFIVLLADHCRFAGGELPFRRCHSSQPSRRAEHGRTINISSDIWQTIGCSNVPPVPSAFGIIWYVIKCIFERNGNFCWLFRTNITRLAGDSGWRSALLEKSYGLASLQHEILSEVSLGSDFRFYSIIRPFFICHLLPAFAKCRSAIRRSSRAQNISAIDTKNMISSTSTFSKISIKFLGMYYSNSSRATYSVS
jgi:hypothetical protein